MRYSIPLAAGVPTKQYFRGKCIVVWDTGAAAEVSMVLFASDEQQREEFGAVGSKTSIFAEQQFSGVELTATVATTVEVIVTNYRVEALDGANFTVTLDASQVPLPVETSRGDAPGNPFYVTGITYDDTPAAANANGAAVAVGAAAVLVAAANPACLERRFSNIGADPMALGAAGLTWAARCLVLNPGDTWVEVKGAALAWYAITDAGGAASATVQELTA